MIEIGRIYVKTAGRDAGKKCVITEILDESYVMIDGQTRNKKCNVKHLEPLNQTVDIKQKPSHSEIVSAFSKLGLEIKESKNKKTSKEKINKPKKTKKVKQHQQQAQAKETRTKEETASTEKGAIKATETRTSGIEEKTG